MANRIDLSNILINFLKKARYERHIEEGTLEENQFYAVTDGNEKTEYGDLFGNIENQADLYNALYASRLFKMEMCNDVRGYDIVHKLYDRREFDLSKFTVVGNPVISEDGIVSGFSGIALTLNYDRLNLYNAEKWGVEFGVYVNNTSGSVYSNECGINLTNSQFPFIGGIYLDGSGCIRFFRKDAWAIYSTAFNVGDFIKAKLNYDNSNGVYSMYISANGGEYTFIKSYTPTDEDKRLNMATSGNIRLVSLDSGGGTSLASGNFDLKYFSITVDGEEVFNGIKDFKRYDTYTLPSSEVITIPYILSVDGVKIVDVAYKPLVDQLYTETGMGNYIIIDETNKTFRLPLPDIYSQIENKTSFTLRKWED